MNVIVKLYIFTLYLSQIKFIILNIITNSNFMKKMKLWKLLQSAMLLLAFTTMVSCVDDNDDMGAPSLEVSPTSLTFGEDGVADRKSVV